MFCQSADFHLFFMMSESLAQFYTNTYQTVSKTIKSYGKPLTLDIGSLQIGNDRL